MKYSGPSPLSAGRRGVGRAIFAVEDTVEDVGEAETPVQELILDDRSPVSNFIVGNIVDIQEVFVNGIAGGYGLFCPVVHRP